MRWLRDVTRKGGERTSRRLCASRSDYITARPIAAGHQETQTATWNHVALTFTAAPLPILEHRFSVFLPLQQPHLKTTAITNVSIDQATTVLRQPRLCAVA